jgi:hypothetical protein
MLINGYMDPLVAVYAVAAVATAMRHRMSGKHGGGRELVAFTLLVAVLSMLKNEGAVLAALLTAVVLGEGVLRERRLGWRILWPRLWPCCHCWHGSWPSGRQGLAMTWREAT